MPRLRIVLTAVLAVAALALVAVPASAAVPSKNTKFCKAAAHISDPSNGGKPTQAKAKAALNGFKKAAKYAPGKVKTAMNNIAKYLGVLAGADSPTDLAKIYTGNGFKTYSNSIGTYARYLAQTCSGTP